MSDPTKTVTLTNAEDVSHFKVGERRSIEDMTPEEAIAVFGAPVYESWLEAKARPRPGGTCIVTRIGDGAIEMLVVPGPEPTPDDYVFRDGSLSGSDE